MNIPLPSEPKNNGPTALVGRQPILDRNKEVFAYELLYRSSSENFVNVMDGDRATLAVITNTFLHAGLNTIVGDKIAFINLTRNFLLGSYPINLPPQRTVLEILEDIALDDPLIQALERLAGQGMQMALDDLTAIDYRIPRLGNLVRYIKVDIAGMQSDQIAQLAAILKQKGYSLIAEKVETPEEYALCRKLGFDYFQGFFFYRPEIIHMRKMDSSRLVVLRALAALQNPDARIEDLEQIISMDPSLSYRLLRLINSGYYAFPTPITSIRHAMMMIGLSQLKTWLSLCLMTQVSDKPHELSQTAMIRAKLAELFSTALKWSNPNAHFLAGLFSVLDGMLDLPMLEILKDIQLAEDIAAALLKRQGKIGEMLSAVEAIEAGNWDPILAYQLAADTINACYVEAIQWAEKSLSLTLGAA